MKILTNKKVIALAITFVLVVALEDLPLSAAKQRRGATVLVNMSDGRKVKGELLAVKDDALLVYDIDAGQGRSIELGQVIQVKVLKKSKFWDGLLIGLGVALGMGICTTVSLGKEVDDKGAAVATIFSISAPVTGLCGGLVGALAGMDKNFFLAGPSSQNRQQSLEQLTRYARERSSEKPDGPE
jgi:hypothetical protein